MKRFARLPSGIPRRSFAVAAAAAAIVSAPATAQEGSETGLSAAQRSQLHALGFAVVPDPVPAGFRIKGVSIDRGGRKYQIEYVRTRDGATMLFAGSAREQEAPKKHGGIFGGIGAAFSHIGHSAATTGNSMRSTSNDQTTPEQEAELTSVESDSALTGPIHFANDKGCLKGSPETSKAVITNASFTVQACSMRQPDPLIRAYKSVVRV